jgi:mannosyl-oligosaccharide alpha-1,2-mannosidase
MSVPNPLDSDSIVVGAWVHLDSSSSGGGNDNDMRTVFTNKAAGCDNHPEQYGLSLYVNAWQEHDHKLYVEYGSSHSGCHKVGSPQAVNVNEWFHVAVSHQRDPSNEEQGVTRIYVNGQSVAKSADGTPPHMVQRNNNFFIGRYDGGAFPFEGNISHFSVVHPLNPLNEGELNKMVAALMRPELIDSVSGIAAHYPLVDAAASKSESKALSTVGGGAYMGTYQFPVHPGKVAHGLRVPLLDGLEYRNGAVPTKAEKDESDKKGQKRADEIKKAMSWIWSNYHQYAYGHDELKPVSKRGNDPWGFMGVTLVDSLDTLWLMGLKDEFWQARDWVRDHLSYAQAGTVSVFETTIRSLGGLLAAYDLSGDRAFLEKARTLGDKLTPAFSTSSGVAWGMVDFHSGRGSGGWSGSSAILSEFGTLQIEFRNLAAYTSTQKYEDMAMKGIKFARGVSPRNGLFPIKMDINSGRFTDHTVTFGALGDSFYEYLLKVWIQGGKQEDWLREMYDRAMDGVMNELLAVSDPDGLVFVADLTGRAQHRKMDHLVCFLPGLLALGAHTDPTGKNSQRARRDLAVAKSLMYTCREMYHRQVSGISPEYVEFPPGKGMTIGSTAPFYILRPETAESLFILNQLTEDPIYREWAWEIWQSIDKHCKAPHGYGALRHVRHPERGIDDRMESFFTAETMKYLWLAQTPDKPIDLDKYVFNTEAHPTKILDGHRPVKA